VRYPELRSVINNLPLTRDIIDFCIQRNIASHVDLDQSKAFDRVNHNVYVCRLESFGFGTDFIKWVKLLYQNIGSRVYVNRF
jgi:Reverse transcriptase (RNA-dependent DNA polymerase)